MRRWIVLMVAVFCCFVSLNIFHGEKAQETVRADQSFFQIENCTFEENDSGLIFNSSNEIEVDFTKPIKLKEFVTSFKLGDEDLFGKTLVASLYRDDFTISFSFTLDAQTFAATCFVNGQSMDFGTLAYRNGEIQLRIAKERTINFATGDFIYRWAMRINGSDNKRSFLSDELARQFDEFSESDFSYSFSAQGISSVSVHRVGDYHFNDYVQLNGLETSKVAFEEISLMWTEVGNGVNSLILEKRIGNEYSKVSLMPSATTYVDSQLTQNTEYTYSIKGYDTDNDSVNIAPVLLASVEPITVKTLVGNPMPYIIGAILAILFIFSILILYAAYPKLKARRNKK